MTRLGQTLLATLALMLIAAGTMVRFIGPRTVSGTEAPRGRTTGRRSASADPLIPVAGVTPARLVDSWEDAREGGARVHHAIDIPAPYGSPVLGVADGRIEKLFHSVRGGLTIYQRSADGGSVYYYAHLDHYRPGLAEGQTIERGTTIGAVGTTGDADRGAPHLHFELHRMAPGEHWWQGREIDPYPWLRSAGTSGPRPPARSR